MNVFHRVAAVGRALQVHVLGGRLKILPILDVHHGNKGLNVEGSAGRLSCGVRFKCGIPGGVASVGNDENNKSAQRTKRIIVSCCQFVVNKRKEEAPQDHTSLVPTEWMPNVESAMTVRVTIAILINCEVFFSQMPQMEK